MAATIRPRPARLMCNGRRPGTGGACHGVTGVRQAHVIAGIEVPETVAVAEADEVERGRGRVAVQYHQFDINDEDGTTGPDLDRGHNALVRVDEGATIVMTGIHTGDVDVTVHETEPAPDDGNWQEIAEISAHSASGELVVRAMMDDPDEDSPSCPSTGPATTGCAFTPVAGTPPSTWPSTRSPSGTSSRPGRHPPNRARCSARPIIMGRQFAARDHCARPPSAGGRQTLRRPAPSPDGSCRCCAPLAASPSRATRPGATAASTRA